MKKFLSLVMALVMTMSLVTIGAGAAEYQDLTDKSEIQYAEAVTVLNKLGIISGYEDGSFRPTGALTRGAAAKIIVSLIQGADFANALTVTAAPYSDVPVTNTFAAVISYCKTAGYINGYSDGTFRPAAALTGYAFTKMLLGALGYKSEYEGFTGAGWTMNVAALGSTAGLFNDFLGDGFKGNDGVNREAACLLALNTLKATEVKYEGGTSISSTTGDLTTSIQQRPTRSYVTSNNGDFNQNISSNKIDSNQSQYYTLEFGEDHFHDLKLRPDVDDYGCPANTWSFKNVKIGTYAKTADFTFTEGIGASTDSDATLETKLGMKNYKLNSGVAVTVNGLSSSVSNVADIARSLAGNGVTVKVYLSDDIADQIDYVSVVRPQPMQINKVTASAVSLNQLDLNAASGDDTKVGVKVQNVESTDEYYNVLKDLKADDIVVITPLTTDGSTYEVDGVLVPTTATGNITAVTLNNNANTNGLTIGDTAYKLSRNWTVEDGRYNLTATSLSTTVETTAYLDAFGYMIYAEDVKAGTDFIILDEVYSNVVNNRVTYYAQGWDTKGNELSLNIGTNSATVTGLNEGEVYQYTESTSNSNADYVLTAAADTPAASVTTAPSNRLIKITSADFAAAGVGTIASGNSGFTFPANALMLGNQSYNSNNYYFDKNVTFVFISHNNGGSDVTGVTVSNNVQTLTTAADTFFVMNKDRNRIISVIVATDTDAEVSANVMYISKVEGVTNVNGETTSTVTAYMTQDGSFGKYENLRLDKRINATATGFYTYSTTSEGVYKVNSYNPSANRTQYSLPNATTGVSSVVLNTNDITGKNYVSQLYLNGSSVATSVNNGLIGVSGSNQLNFSGATFVDLLDMHENIHEQFSSLGDLVDYASETGKNYNFTIALMLDNSTGTSTTKNRVSYVYLLRVDAGTAMGYSLPSVANIGFYSDAACTTSISSAMAGSTVYLKSTQANRALDTITINGITVTANQAGVASFTMPGNAVAAGYFGAPATVAAFDVAGDHAYQLSTDNTNWAAANSGLTDVKTGATVYVKAASGDPIRTISVTAGSATTYNAVNGVASFTLTADVTSIAITGRVLATLPAATEMTFGADPTNVITVTLPKTATSTPSVAEAAAFVKIWVEQQTGNAATVTSASGTYTYTVNDANGIPTTYTFAPATDYKMYVTLDGNSNTLVQVGGQVKNLAGADATSYIQIGTGSGATYTSGAGNASSIPLVRGETYTTGYHKVTLVAVDASGTSNLGGAVVTTTLDGADGNGAVYVLGTGTATVNFSIDNAALPTVDINGLITVDNGAASIGSSAPSYTGAAAKLVDAANDVLSENSCTVTFSGFTGLDATLKLTLSE